MACRERQTRAAILPRKLSKRFADVRLKTSTRPDLPPLSWAISLNRGSSEAALVHGRGVEVGGDFVVEGAWSGRFADHAFDTATTFTGTGARVGGDRLIVSTPTHTLQPLYACRLPNRLVISNSMLFALHASGRSLDPMYRYHDVDIMSIVLGVDRSTTSLPTSGPERLELFYYCNLSITKNLALDRLPKTPTRGFTAFEEYAAFLQHEMSAVAANARAQERTIPLGLLSTLSSGYDSPACAVLAKRAGCTSAITFRTAADAFGGGNDSGVDIGRILGLATVELDPIRYQTAVTIPEAEFLAPGYGGDDVIYCGAEPLLANRILVTGYHGDRVWSRSGPREGGAIQRGDPSGGSLSEFRLRASFNVLPVPFIGCTALRAIREISDSPAMRAWSVAAPTAYDRPIPRRIVEEAGVPRGMFGVTKRAAARPARAADVDDPPLHTVLSPAALDNFAEWASGVPRFVSWLDLTTYCTLHCGQELIRHGVTLLARLFPASRGFGSWDWYRLRRTGIPWKYAKSRNQQSLLVYWAHERLKNRYSSIGESGAPF